MEYKESITSDNSYHITKEVNGEVYSISVDNAEADDVLKQLMKDSLDRRSAGILHG